LYWIDQNPIDQPQPMGLIGRYGLLMAFVATCQNSLKHGEASVKNEENEGL
jgi:hypothetical protein